ncbi:MAG: hypothetical protein ACRC7O_14920 [Fimbriiglobus sp.]
MAGELQFGGVVEDEDEREPGHGLEGLGAVRGRDGVRSGGLLVAQAVERLERCPVEDLGERLLRVGRDLGGRRDQSLGPAGVTQVDAGEVLEPIQAQKRPLASRP